ncbi:MAG: hypothetical protein O3A06_04285 [Proteobacteria bacterium]|nr:hypothetical protein [Pseudomonadota bacterium]MDA0982255.1 hypothetical protein [Pseudomonadota bacterium]
MSATRRLASFALAGQLVSGAEAQDFGAEREQLVAEIDATYADTKTLTSLAEM